MPEQVIKILELKMTNGMKSCNHLKDWRTQQQQYCKVVTQTYLGATTAQVNTVALRDGTGKITANIFDGVATRGKLC